jgi:hypothetical protein
MTDQSNQGRRTILFVAGSGRSGTSVISGALQRLGYTVPQPEVPADDSNPRGFAESRWVVDLHTRLLTQASVETADARPGAWTDAAAVANDGVAEEISSFLRGQFARADHLLIKDPRMVWFLPIWRRAAAELGVEPRLVTMLRHPAAVVDSKSRSYGSWRGDVSRAAGWINTMLYAERATRDSQRAYVRYEDLLADWPREIGRVTEHLKLDAVADATAAQIRAAESFVDPALKRSASSWDEMRIPSPLQDQAEHVWDLLLRLVSEDSAGRLTDEFDAARAAYASLYGDAEAIAASSVNAARRGRRPRAELSKQRVPQAIRRRVPRRLQRPLRAAARRFR